MSAAPATRCVRQSGFIKVGEHMRQPVGTSENPGLGYGAEVRAHNSVGNSRRRRYISEWGCGHWSTFRASPITVGRGFKVLSSFLHLRYDGVLYLPGSFLVLNMQRFRSLF